jgi:alpha-1,2-mannosyltransferase
VTAAAPVVERDGDGAAMEGPASLWSRLSARMRVAAVVASAGGFVALAVWSAVAALTRPGYDRLADLHVYVGAVRAVRDGIPLYSVAAENGDPFTYPPFALLVFWPLGVVPEPLAQVLWTVATVVTVVVIAAALTARQRVDGRQRFVVVTLAAAAVLLASAPVQSNLRFGQVSIFVVLLALLDAFGLLPRRLGGVLIGVAAAIKLTPLLFVPYLWFVGRRRDAVRALVAFVGCAVVAFVAWPAASVTFWTQAIFTTSRIGDLSSTGNQSLNGVLLRYAVPTAERGVLWAALAALVCVVAFLCAPEYHRRGSVALAAVVIGCATVAVSPVSWTHHQVWTVLAGLLLVAGPRRGRVAAGMIVLITMTLSIGAVLPLSGFGPVGDFLRQNVRALCAVAVCCGGAVSLWHTAAGRVRLLPGLTLVGRPRTALLYCVAAAGAAPAGGAPARGPAPHDRVVTAQVYSAETAQDPVWADEVGTNPCMGLGESTSPDGTAQYVCADITGPAMGGAQLNFSLSAMGDDGAGAIIEGEAGADVARLTYVPVQGAAPIDVPLLPILPAPASVPASPDAARAGKPNVPVVDQRTHTTHRFAVASNDTSDALLLAYDTSGRIVGQGRAKLNDR